ncbi:transferase family protein [Aspergillus rambellii]|uniref:Transferase family protein n=1 Tax=Aspergillus rambellii TaxID=308745 RepID=A0A0F8X4T6_9EURO|nr:transferase family protein [Aspergillus rambellii]
MHQDAGSQPGTASEQWLMIPDRVSEKVTTTHENPQDGPRVGGAGPSNDNSSSKALEPNEEVRKTSRLILDIIFDYALNKFDDSRDRLEAGADHFLSIIDPFVAVGKRVEACLPAFPFKSANKVYKVLGKLPDKAEELALDRLNTMCTRIREVYPPGAQVTIISDGITYNDLLCISDQDTWAYGEALRKMATKKKFHWIGFSRIRDLLDFPLPEKLSEISYVANCTTFRRLLLNKYGRDDLNIDHEISSNPDTKLTYLGYKRFLESDLKHIFPRGADRSAHSYKRDCKYLAKQMLIRGYAFAGAVKNAFPNHLRLSIHESVGSTKVSICLLNTRTGFTTPWHCSVAQIADGEWISAPMGEFGKDNNLELVYEDGRPSYFKEKPQEGHALGTSETTATYLQQARLVSASEYLNGASTPSIASSAVASASNSTTLSPRMTVGTSRATTPGTQSPLSLASNGPDLTAEDKLSKLSSAPSPELADGAASIPYGKRLIPQIMDSLAAAEPGRIVFSMTTLSGDSPEFRPISARAFTQAVDKTAWWLQNQVGKPNSIQPLGYIGPHDLRHVLLTYACVKAGYAALFLSPKNNTEGALAVLEATACNIWVNAGEVSPAPLVKEILQKRAMNVLQLPLLDELLDAASTEPFPYTKTFDEAINDPFCFLHTSGTTGVPKPIPWSHGLIGTMDAVRLLPPVGNDNDLLPWTSDWKSGNKIYSSFPMSHGAGIIMDILMPALFELHCVLGPVGVLPNVNLVETLAEYAKIDIWSMVPSLVDELGETPGVLSKLKSSKFICASGGPVSPVSAGKVNEVIRVLNLTGTTEGLFIGNLITPREDWFWFCFHPYSGFEFKEIEADTYEHWVHRNEHWPLFQGIFHTFPDKQSINFKDLYMKHPTKPNLWAFKGRSDDLVVLSNGYKISPLETEAFVTTHPAIKGCLVFGTGKPQAGLLVELKDPSHKTDELLDSIWETVQKANSMSRHKNQLLRDFVTFAEPDKPFFRTDKGTVKRAATLKLYTDYIERFYSSRSDDLVGSFTIDMSSTESIQDNIHKILVPLLPEPQDVGLDMDLFALGLDSLGVFAAIKTIRAATGLGDRIAPRHVYGHPTISGLSSTVELLLAEMTSASEAASSDQPAADDELANMKTMITQHKARQSFRLNAFDYVNPNHGMGLVLYLPLREGVKYEQVFSNLQEGLNRTFDLIPALGGKMMNCSEQEIGYTKGDLCVTIPPRSRANSAHNRLVYKDLSSVLPSFDKLRDAGFAPSAFKDSLVLRDDPFPKMPALIFVGQANFVQGGCLIAVDLNHCCLDGLGAMVALKAWAENCRYLQGDQAATCDWYDPESFNHSLPEIIHEQEGWTQPLQEVDPGTWGFLPFFPPENESQTTTIHGESRRSKNLSNEGALPPRPIFPLHSVWPLPRAERCLKTTLFLIPPDKLEKMKQDVIADPAAKGVIKSISDIVQAFFWRAAIRARYRVATEIRKQTFGPEEMSILELPTDGRPYFSSLLPSTYMGSLLILNRSSMPIETLCSPKTTIGEVAFLLRQSTTRITPSLVHDAFTILQSLPDHSRFSTANMGLEHMHAMISNMMLFPSGEICFGDKFFANGGSPESMRPQLERGNGRFRFLVIFPIKKDGGVELVLGTHPEELDMFQSDEEFTKYADLVDYCY